VLRGALGGDAAKRRAGRDAITQVFAYVQSGDGFYCDGSFVQHGKVPYTASYGAVLMDSLSRAISREEGAGRAGRRILRDLLRLSGCRAQPRPRHHRALHPPHLEAGRGLGGLAGVLGQAGLGLLGPCHTWLHTGKWVALCF
jgi:hypothetical protein